MEIIVVFGKNEDDLSKSMKKEDFDFFKEFPNIQIRYEKRLHAKYYASESIAILTSMNLYSFSQDNNIEAGVMTKTTLLGNITSVISEDSFDDQAWDYFGRVIEQSKLLFHKEPKFDKGKLGTGLGKKYLHSDIEIDLLSDFFENRTKYDSKKKKPVIIEDRIDNVKKNKKVTKGYCIRTCVEIPFNVKKPLSNSAYKQWNKYGDSNYAEKFCHFSGEDSNGETSVNKPILKKNWRKAKQQFGL